MKYSAKYHVFHATFHVILWKFRHTWTIEKDVSKTQEKVEDEIIKTQEKVEDEIGTRMLIEPTYKVLAKGGAHYLGEYMVCCYTVPTKLLNLSIKSEPLGSRRNDVCLVSVSDMCTLQFIHTGHILLHPLQLARDSDYFRDSVG